MSGRRRAVRIGQYEVEYYHFRWVEAELRRYPDRVRRIAWLEECIATESGHDDDGIPKSPGVGDPTFSRVVAMERNRELHQLRAWRRTIDSVMDGLPINQRRVVETLYFDGRYTLDGAADALRMGRATVCRLRNRALLAFVATLIGDHAIRVVA